MKVGFLTVLVLLLVVSFSLARDPFKKILPEKPKFQPKEYPKSQPREYLEERIDSRSLESLKIEGVFWDIPTPQVIINGEVYREGDVIAEAGAKITEIKKNKITLIYKDRMFMLSPEKEEMIR
ncbi:MAG TPA: hypothetical protein ENI31_03410 [Candidatus Omnitrophica bacterium]|nr:MAG: hypothetical protein DRP61_00120 [Candidatus Omnitrophota bacterium]RKY35391.1 MAG: hypothetical protein DRP69_01560 [Candidatus Omnitrophota bacterium]RKY44878.1 MAG: hypothetical protein DRP80_00785 [Candidatus Omnitrophota bacterium]HEC69318.1 hypothetical protein [Candidatus Omnitrophota bacterium]